MNYEKLLTIMLGTGLKTADDFCEALMKADCNLKCNINVWGYDILGKPTFKVADKKTEVDLVIVSNAELGFENGATVKETYSRAKEFGLELCPNEVGPQLRLQYKDQPKGEWLLVAMEPITDSFNGSRVFNVGRLNDGERILDGYSARLDLMRRDNPSWVFLRRK
ncbi:MAG: hypothetical protein Q8P86_00455 [bacterium]|nr:hypothetical protein [bacterium]